MKKNKRLILFISQWETPWGVKKGVGVPERHRLIKRWASEGYEVYVVSGTTRKGMQNKREDSYTQFYFKLPLFQWALKNLPVKPRSTINFIIYKVFSIWDIAVFTIFATIKAFKVTKSMDVALIYSFGEFGVLASKFIARLRGVPFIVRLYGTILYSSFKSIGSLSWKRFLYVPLINYLAFRINADQIIVTDDDCKADLLPRFMKIQAPMALIRNGVDRSFFLNVKDDDITLTKKAYDLDKYDIVIGNIGRFAELKRNHLLLKALPKVISAIRGVKIGVILIGGGESLKKYEDIIQQNDLQPYVKIWGPVSREEIPVFFYCIDIYYSVLAQSNQCFAFLEAMVTGRCVITTDELRENEFVINNKTVVMVHESDNEEEMVNSIAEKIIFLVRNEKFRNMIARNAKLYAERFVPTVDEAVEKEFEIAKNLIKK